MYYLKNNPSPVPLSAHLKSALDGSPVTADVSVTVSGTAGAGTLTHISAGEWRYTPTQAETNADAFTVRFEADDALAVLYDVHPISVNVASHLTDILADTAELQANQGNWLTATGFSTHSAADVKTAIEQAGSSIAQILADTSELQEDWAEGGRLELQLTTAAGGLTVMPIVATVSAGEVSTQDIVQYANTSSAVHIFVLDSDGNAVDLTGRTLHFNVYDDKRLLLFSRTTDNGIVLGGEDNNMVTVGFTTSNTAVANVGSYSFDLRDETNGEELMQGTFTLRYSHKVS